MTRILQISIAAMVLFILGSFFQLQVYGDINTDSADIAARFDHGMHNTKVFKPLKIDCNHCHNFTVDPTTSKVIPNEKMKESIFKMPIKGICHECHRSSETKYEAAPKTCFTCHRSMENLKAIKPENHNIGSWRSSHGTDARIAGNTCLNCHMTSQCVKCHSQRQDIEPVNHTRNFLFFHSVQARLQPQKCDTCHTKSYCTSCHLGLQKH